VLAAPVQHDRSRTWPTPADHSGLAEALTSLGDEAAAALVADAGGSRRDVEVVLSVDARYEGQSHELRVAQVEDFPEAHRRQNGYDRPGHPVEVITLRASARRASALDPARLRSRKRPPMEGPAVVVEDDTTIWVPIGWKGEPGPAGTLILKRAEPEDAT
jgi:N-methylhydantoinase A/oxoprolinase/acetone carboxylase beta subunit